jgi:hypothetical protein
MGLELNMPRWSHRYFLVACFVSVSVAICHYWISHVKYVILYNTILYFVQMYFTNVFYKCILLYKKNTF